MDNTIETIEVTEVEPGQFVVQRDIPRLRFYLSYGLLAVAYALARAVVWIVGE